MLVDELLFSHSLAGALTRALVGFLAAAGFALVLAELFRWTRGRRFWLTATCAAIATAALWAAVPGDPKLAATTQAASSSTARSFADPAAPHSLFLDAPGGDALLSLP